MLARNCICMVPAPRTDRGSHLKQISPFPSSSHLAKCYPNVLLCCFYGLKPHAFLKSCGLFGQLVRPIPIKKNKHSTQLHEYEEETFETKYQDWKLSSTLLYL